jgi:hypothetical protein
MTLKRDVLDTDIFVPDLQVVGFISSDSDVSCVMAAPRSEISALLLGTFFYYIFI